MWSTRNARLKNSLSPWCRFLGIPRRGIISGGALYIDRTIIASEAPFNRAARLHILLSMWHLEEVIRGTWQCKYVVLWILEGMLTTRNHRFTSSWARIELQARKVSYIKECSEFALTKCTWDAHQSPWLRPGYHIYSNSLELHFVSFATWPSPQSHTWENRNHVSVLRPIVPLHDQLMSSCYQRQAIVMIERFWNILPKRVPCTSGRYTPSASVIWIRP